MQKNRKNQWAVSEVFKDGLKDGRTNGLTDGQGRLLRKPLGKSGVQNILQNKIDYHHNLWNEVYNNEITKRYCILL